MANDTDIKTIERSITKIARNMGRWNLGRSLERRLGGLIDFSHVAVVGSLSELSETGTSATVGQLARRMDVDPSRASRMVAKAIRAGYAKRMASQEDGRRTCVALTKKGEEFETAIKDLRSRYFTSHLKGWSEKDRETFARLLTRFLREGRQQSDADDPSEMIAAEAAERGIVVPLRRPVSTGLAKPKRRER
jgi:DNA-binding MarR family transcriptional regulator